MFEKIKKIAEKNLLLWALLMGAISTCILIIGRMLININGSSNNYEDVKPILKLLNVIFSFIVLHLFFTFFSLTKTLGALFRITNTVLFSILFFTIYIFASDNMEYLDQRITFIPVVDWTNNGHEPPEQELSSVFYWFVFMCLSFVNVVLINLIHIKILQNKKMLIYSAIIILAITLLLTIFLIILK